MVWVYQVCAGSIKYIMFSRSMQTVFLFLLLTKGEVTVGLPCFGSDHLAESWKADFIWFEQNIIFGVPGFCSSNQLWSWLTRPLYWNELTARYAPDAELGIISFALCFSSLFMLYRQRFALTMRRKLNSAGFQQIKAVTSQPRYVGVKLSK